MKKKTGGIIGAAAVAVAAGLLCYHFLGSGAASDQTQVAYVTSVETLEKLGSGSGMLNRYAGAVESGETWSVQQNSEKTVKEILVSVGDEVTVGTPLFTYDVEQFQSSLATAQLELERLKNELSSMETAIANLQQEKAKADSASQAAYTMEIQNQELQKKGKEFDIQSKQLEIDKLNENIQNATVLSELDGVVKSINTGTDSSSSDTSFLTVMKTGSYRVKGTINEQNVSALSEGEAVLIYSRVDSSQYWKGTITKIDLENSISSGSDYYYSGSGNSSTSYPFYVELESSDGMMLGQHVYVEADLGQAELQASDSVWLPSYLIVDANADAPYVWAKGNENKLEKRSVTLGSYNEALDGYEITDGLSKEDAVASPTEELQEGMEVSL